MAAKKKQPEPAKQRERHDLYLRLMDKELHPRVQFLSDRMGFNSTNRVGEVALTIGISVMENPAYWSARLDGVLDTEIAKFINEGLDKRMAEKRKSAKAG